ncbi:MAG: hypothetical protein ACYC2H_07350 [Thermoplasmatota archaeon]
MGRLSLAALPALALALALAAWAPAAEAGTPEAPEIVDPSGDHVVAVVPVGESGQFLNADLLAGWVTEDADNLYFHIDMAGTGAPGTAGPYTWVFHATAGGADVEMSGTSTADQPTPGGAATTAALEDGIVILTVPRLAFGGATELTALFIESYGGVPDQVQPDVAISDTAPDDGADAGISYTITGGGSGGSPGDSDGDGLNDTKEVEQFGNVTAQNGTGDPDADGLNNTAEFNGGTNATKADTDGDGLNDKEDPFPLDPTQPGGNETDDPYDTDGDGLNDTWEDEHFGNLTAQSGSGDPDSDGLNNTAELAAGTDPNDADTDGDGLNDSTDPKPLTAAVEGNDRLEMYAGAPMFAAVATLCLFALARLFP